MVGQVTAHLVVACLGQGLVIVGAEHGLNSQLLGQGGQGLACRAMQHQQACVVALADAAQFLVQLSDSGMDEVHTSILAGQVLQNLGVKNKGHVHALAVAQGQVQRRVVVQAQIASQPDQSGGVIGLHGRRGLPLKSVHDRRFCLH